MRVIGEMDAKLGLGAAGHELGPNGFRDDRRTEDAVVVVPLDDGAQPRAGPGKGRDSARAKVTLATSSWFSGSGK